MLELLAEFKLTSEVLLELDALYAFALLSSFPDFLIIFFNFFDGEAVTPGNDFLNVDRFAYSYCLIYTSLWS